MIFIVIFTRLDRNWNSNFGEEVFYEALPTQTELATDSHQIPLTV